MATMARAIWKGAISFGLVNVPVQLYGATESKQVHFNQFQEKTGKRVHNKRVAEGSGREVAYDDIVKGYELDSGKYVMVTPDELESVEPGRTHTIDIEDFIDIEEIDPIYFDRTYYMVPTKDSGASRAYALLHQAMEDAGRVAIARFVLRTKQHLVAIRPYGRVMALATLWFADEVRDPADQVGDLPRHVKAGDKELKIAKQLIDSLTTSWDPKRYKDTYRSKVLDLIKRKGKGEEIEVEAEPEEAKVLDLMAALEASLNEKRGGSKAKRSTAKRASASPSSASDDLASKSREELYEEATKRKVPGRSKMTKDELVSALKEAS
jgi:DNA end-binding protein Ku